jgi:AbiV family abortive infection protein
LKTKLDAYKGRLSPAQIAEGMNAASKNAHRIAQDARLMLEAGRFPSAASLAVLAIEEAGKVSILRGLALAKDEKAIANCWKDYRSHTRKNATWLLPQLVAEGARRLDDFRQLFDKSSDHPCILDQIKQIGFYTDCLGKAHWSIPEVVIDDQLAKMLVEIAEIFSKEKIVSQTEIELWVKHMGPVWMTDVAAMKQALVDWQADMQRHGLIEEGINKMAQFIHLGLNELD